MAGRSAVIRALAAGFLIASLAGCGGATDPSAVVVGTRQCGIVVPAPELTVRLAEYHRGDTRAWLVTACGPRGTACTPIVTLHHSPPPAIMMAGSRTLRIATLGGAVTKIHAQGFRFRDDQPGYSVRIDRAVGRPPMAWRTAYFRRIGLPDVRYQHDPCAQHRAAHPDPDA